MMPPSCVQTPFSHSMFVVSVSNYRNLTISKSSNSSRISGISLACVLTLPFSAGTIPISKASAMPGQVMITVSQLLFRPEL